MRRQIYIHNQNQPGFSCSLNRRWPVEDPALRAKTQRQPCLAFGLEGCAPQIPRIVQRMAAANVRPLTTFAEAVIIHRAPSGTEVRVTLPGIR